MSNIIIGSLLWILGMIYGMASIEFKLPPYDISREAWAVLKTISPHLAPKTPTTLQPYNPLTSAPSPYPQRNVEKLISIHSLEDVKRLRLDLIKTLWGAHALPAVLPSVVVEHHVDNRYQEIDSLARIDKITIEMEFDILSHVYHFHPNEPNGGMVLFHAGHDGDFVTSKAEIRQLIDHGYSVTGFAMPLVGLNNKPPVDVPRIGLLQLNHHDVMRFLTPKRGHPVKYFLEPVVVVLNYLESHYDYRFFAMTGISGGGWTTTLAAAVDERIGLSFPVAGSYPIFLRANNKSDWGDFEQNDPAVYTIANYLELYVMGSHGSGRGQLQLLNQYDPCCFSGTRSHIYVDVVRERVRSIGEGEFDVYLDSSHREHIISDLGMEKILSRLGSAVR